MVSTLACLNFLCLLALIILDYEQLGDRESTYILRLKPFCPKFRFDLQQRQRKLGANGVENF